MKKALIVLLILAVAGGLFAQSWSGSVTTGAKFTFAEDMPVAADDDDGHAVKAGLSWANSDDDWGVNVSANANISQLNDDGEYSTNGLDIGDMNGWVKFADMFKLTAGKGVGGAWGTGGNTDTDISSSDAGARLEITPIDGLNFGFRFGYANNGVAVAKVANFFQEIGIGAKYDGGAWNVALGLDLDSEETNGAGLDALAYFGFNYTGLSLMNIHFGGKINNLFAKAGDMTVDLYEQLSGSVASLSWELDAHEGVQPTPLTMDVSANLEYAIPINDKASAVIGADAGLTILDEFSFDSWDIYAKLTYNFNGNVSTSFKFEVDGEVDPNKITPFLLWNIGFSF